MGALDVPPPAGACQALEARPGPAGRDGALSTGRDRDRPWIDRRGRPSGVDGCP